MYRVLRDIWRVAKPGDVLGADRLSSEDAALFLANGTIEAVEPPPAPPAPDLTNEPADVPTPAPKKKAARKRAPAKKTRGKSRARKSDSG
jgi:hypothetical protein